jgi:preprotein translocase subunit SecB
MTEENNQASSAEGPQFTILRVYLKDVSFETPNSPAVFTQEWNTVTAKQGDKTGFLAEVDQAGVFTVKGFDDAQKGHTLGAFCPNTLYPFAREAISDLVVKGGFPQLLLAPINFDALYAEKINQVNAQVTSPEQGAH